MTPLLAERFFGSTLELTSHDNYCPFWASDAQDPNSKPVGSEDGESVVQVSQRVHTLFQVGRLSWHTCSRAVHPCCISRCLGVTGE